MTKWLSWTDWSFWSLNWFILNTVPRETIHMPPKICFKIGVCVCIYTNTHTHNVIFISLHIYVWLLNLYNWECMWILITYICIYIYISALKWMLKCKFLSLSRQDLLKRSWQKSLLQQHQCGWLIHVFTTCFCPASMSICSLTIKVLRERLSAARL